jgi:hypothetical protein
MFIIAKLSIRSPDRHRAELLNHNIIIINDALKLTPFLQQYKQNVLKSYAELQT